MSVETQSYVRKPFEVEAVQVTEENMREVAEWCQGRIQRNQQDDYIKVRVHNPMTPKQSMAFVGDWVLYANNGYKVYSPKAFAQNFQPKDDDVSHRSAETGQYVTEEFAEENPETTVTETDD